MSEIVASGLDEGQYARRSLNPGEVIRVGRAPRDGWRVGWDARISREHADLTLRGDSLHVLRLDSARNPILCDNGKINDELVVKPGESFRIGRTKFRFHSKEGLSGAHDPLAEVSFSSEELADAPFLDAYAAAEALAKLRDVVASARTPEDLAAGVNRLLLNSIEGIQVCALLNRVDTEGDSRIIGFDCVEDFDGPFKPSRRLMKEATLRNKTVFCLWGESVSDSMFTMGGNMDWAICTPMESEACAGWCLYISGKLSNDNPLTVAQERRGDMRLLNLIAGAAGDLQHLNSLRQQQSTMSQFFCPAVMETLSTDTDGRSLMPREGNITVLFCDLRGFSRHAEKANQNLLQLLERVSQALGVMTKGIVGHEGAIADFQGDAALAFWGWPTEPEDGPLPACRAAREIFAEFVRSSEQPGHPLADFKVGIGIAQGLAIAGLIGTKEQSKVGVFGDTVNTAARLEGMTKQFKAPILIDENTAKWVHRAADPSLGRVRFLGQVLPAGKDIPVKLYELLAPEGECALTADDLLIFEQAVNLFIAGNWEEAKALYTQLAPKDPASERALDTIADFNDHPPADWNGVIALTKK